MNGMRLLLHAGTISRLGRDGILRDHGVRANHCIGSAPSMDQRLISYVRPLRRRWGLTQRELAFLIGAKTHSAISQIEALKAYPPLAGAIACSIIFDTPTLELFPELH